MHRCLLVNEILSIVFENFFYSNDPSGPTLAALARTCRVFSEPALDLLWREIETLSVLLQCMPSDLWTLSEEYEEEEGYPMLTFTRELTERDWARFEHYAVRVRVFGSGRLGDPFVGVHRSALLALCIYRPVKALLPSLRSLVMQSRYTSYDVPFLQALLGPSLRQIRAIGTEMDAQEIDSLCIPALRLCPNIQEISMDVNDHMPASFSKLIGSSASLTHVIFSSMALSEEVVECLSRHPNLKELECVQVSKSGVLRFTTASGRFPSLEELGCRVSDWSTATTFVRQMQCYFRKLSIVSDNHGGDVAASSVLEIMMAIGQHTSISSLTELKLFCEYGVLSGDNLDDASTSGIFEPLFRCVALRRLGLSFRAIVTLDDAWLLKASRAWPCIHSIQLHGFGSRPSRMTLAGLVPLAKHCPNLENLVLTLDASPISPRLLDGVCNPKVTWLGVATSTIKSPRKVIHSLVRLFPSLLGVSYWYSGAHAKEWKEVDRGLYHITH